MNLNDAQRQAVTGWIAAGAKLSEVQNQLATEFGLRLTYMEVRFLVDDLKLQLQDPEPPKPEPAASPQPAASPAAPAEAATDGLAGGVSVTVDQLTRPGSLVSGKVTFSDGIKADWYLDQTGRLGLIPQKEGYKPAAGDVQQFQAALEREMMKLGF